MKWMAFGVVVFSSVAFAYDPYGVCHLSKETVDKVICDGPAVLTDSTVTGDVKVTGSLTATNLAASASMTAGAATLKNVTVKGLVSINGDLYADHSTFNQNVQATANTTTLNECSVKGSVIINVDNEHAPTVHIECGSLVNGDVEFKGKKPGLVQVTDDSFLKGKVINGTMEFVRQTCSRK